MAPKMLATQQKSKRRAGFLDLPSELRNSIYDLVFKGKVPICVEWTGSTIGASREPDFVGPEFFKPTSTAANLLRTSRQIHHEASSILYGANQFIFSDTAVGQLWAAAIGRAIMQVREIQVDSLFTKPSYGVFAQGDSYFSIIKSFVALLENARQLENLRLRYWWTPSTTSRGLSRLLLPVCLMMMRRAKQENPVCRVTDMLGWLDVMMWRSRELSKPEAGFMEALVMMLEQQLRTPEEADMEETEILEAVQAMFKSPHTETHH
ncbi:hypothetical protein Slin15195_G122610 [Septoria linicola]|uniref:Uncharacterized protein n=1 Tax=Septoria linicola TaxID=215465 RepID=A0A9Q9AZM1_9PEZI|nr:hypothetical protein Slin14017_G078810 [Septoria linicola]USW58942.1 hypothetical protein Slin15195_G122610 [Septoria linicola]